MTIEMGIALTVLALLGTAAWRIYIMIRDTRGDLEKQIGLATAAAQLGRQELADHRLHTAETYVTKAGMSEQTAQIIKALENLGGRIDGIHARLDSWSRHGS